MKKLLLAISMVILFVCLFAVAVSAEETNAIPEWPSTVTILEGMSDKATFGADGTAGATSRVLMSDGNAYPAYYVFSDKSSFSISLTEINKKGVTYTNASIVRVEVPNGIVTAGQTCMTKDGGYTSVKTITLPNTVTTIGAGAFKLPTLISINLPNSITSVANNVFNGCTSLKSIVIPSSMTDIPQTMFYGCTALETVDFSNATSLRTIGYQAFYNTTALEKVILPEGLTSIANVAFKNSGVKEVYLPSTLVFENVGTNSVFGECARLHTVTSKATFIADNMFYNSSVLENLYLENTITIGESAFYKAVSLTSLTLPNTLTTIGKNAFAYASFDKIIVPASVTSFGDGTFKENDFLETAVILGSAMGSNMFLNCSNMTRLVITEKFETFGSYALNGVNRNSFTTFYTGSTNDFDTIKGIITLDRVSSAKPSSYTDYKNGTHTQYKYIFIYGANLCEVAYGEHNIPEPTYHFTSYTEPSSIKGVCKRCGIEEIRDTIDAMFTCLGYSAPEFGNGGISIGFAANQDSIETYEKETGKTVNYGLFAVSKSKAGSNTVFDENGALLDGAIRTDLTGRGYDLFELRIVGFTKEEHKAAEIAMGGFVAVKDENGTTYSYMQADAPNENENYSYVSYNEIVGNN